MKHRVFGKKLGRNFNERQALLKSLVRSIFTHGSINTTEAKAKAVTPSIERLSNIITSKPDLVARRELFRVLQDQAWVNKVMESFKSVFTDQKSNFTKITRVKYRQGDDALIVNLSFVKAVSFKEDKKAAEETKTKKTTKKETVKPVKEKTTKTKKVVSKKEQK